MAGVVNRSGSLAKLLNAKHVSDTNNGHAIQREEPQLVIHAIRQVVEAVRSGSHQVASDKKSELPPIAENSRIALKKRLMAVPSEKCAP